MHVANDSFNNTFTKKKHRISFNMGRKNAVCHFYMTYRNEYIGFTHDLNSSGESPPCLKPRRCSTMQHNIRKLNAITKHQWLIVFGTCFQRGETATILQLIIQFPKHMFDCWNQHIHYTLLTWIFTSPSISLFLFSSLPPLYLSPSFSESMLNVQLLHFYSAPYLLI